MSDGVMLINLAGEARMDDIAVKVSGPPQTPPSMPCRASRPPPALSCPPAARIEFREDRSPGGDHRARHLGGGLGPGHGPGIRRAFSQRCLLGPGPGDCPGPGLGAGGRVPGPLAGGRGDPVWFQPAQGKGLGSGVLQGRGAAHAWLKTFRRCRFRWIMWGW